MRLSILVISFLLVTSTLQGKIVFYSARDGNLEIYTMNSAGENQTRLTDYDESDFFPVWSPNGQQIAFARFLFNRRGDKNEEIYVMDADGTNLRNLTQHPALDSGPNWSPDGSQIAFVAITELGRQVYAMNADGTVRWLVSEPRPNAWMHLGGWSPDGKQILYKGSINGLVTDSFVVIATLDSRRRKVLKHEEVPIEKMNPATVSWGAGGRSILFAGKKEGEKGDIYRFRLSDNQLIQLTDHPASDTFPQEWNPQLPVSPQRLTPKRWGEIKSNSYRHRGIGRGSAPPIP
jgi:TolB protein